MCPPPITFPPSPSHPTSPLPTPPTPPPSMHLCHEERLWRAVLFIQIMPHLQGCCTFFACFEEATKMIIPAMGQELVTQSFLFLC